MLIASNNQVQFGGKKTVGPNEWKKKLTKGENMPKDRSGKGAGPAGSAKREETNRIIQAKQAAAEQRKAEAAKAAEEAQSSQEGRSRKGKAPVKFGSVFDRMA